MLVCFVFFSPDAENVKPSCGCDGVRILIHRLLTRRCPVWRLPSGNRRRIDSRCCSQTHIMTPAAVFNLENTRHGDTLRPISRPKRVDQSEGSRNDQILRAAIKPPAFHQTRARNAAAERRRLQKLMEFITGEKCFCKRAPSDAKRRSGKDS